MITWSILLFADRASPYEQKPPKGPLRVGVIAAPPLYTKTPDNRWEGFSIELWQAVGERLGVQYEFQEFSTFDQLVNALEEGRIDVIPTMPVSEGYESKIDFSQSYLKSGLSIAVPGEGSEYRGIRVFESMASKRILKAIGFMMLMTLLAGIVVWTLEKRRNSEMFGGGCAEGIGQGIWWAIVTMTTVGYGDKTPKTMGGRFVAFIWMVFSIVFIASFTADITASLTISELRGKVRGFDDLYSARVGSVTRSEGFSFLAAKGISVVPYDGLEDGLQAVAGKGIDAFVSNDQVLKHMVKSEFPGQVQILPGTFNEYFVSAALQQDSPLREPINKALLQFMKTRDWTELLNRHLK